MVLDGIVAHAEVHGPTIATVSGVRVGDPESAVMAVYGDQLRVEPHPYTPDGHYLVFEPISDADADYQLISRPTGPLSRRCGAVWPML